MSESPLRTRCHAIVLAGGASRRMGTRKERLDLNGEPNLLRLCRLLHGMADRVTVVTDARETYSFLPEDIAVVRDRVPDRGPVGGICTGMGVSDAPLQLVAGCDYPLVSEQAWFRLLRQLEANPNADAVVPVAFGKEHPLCAVYRARTLPLWEAALAAGELRVRRTVDRMSTVFRRMEDEEEAEYVNMNEPEDYAAVKERLS
ncbi:molybdenum cofactor guanylyltransferase [Cohnella sp. REN36]|uniref:molybdenum cofactor guanylyltransferase n=1 Tax=Cohnella sp. REN36 TaxID=2887347 RepID=UPI001D1418A1|nr:molybdenum cofactor guanylyltransferase [Cohnella sp. REN36]MCC3374954.1 molybdenum cofactor guanylyltransferase [Cohnella sp. REN36]